MYREEEFQKEFRPYGDDVELRLEENWWPSHIDPIDLPVFPLKSWRHVLDGELNAPGGGHLWDIAMRRGILWKTAFPSGWGPGQVGEASALALRQAAHRLSVPAKELKAGVSYVQRVNVYGAELMMLVRLDYGIVNGGVLTSYPLGGDGVGVVVAANRMKYQPITDSRSEEWP